MSTAINNMVAPDAYSAAATLICPSTVRIRLFVANQGIYWEQGRTWPGGQGIFWDPPEQYLPPLGYSFSDRCEALRFRAAIPLKSLPPGSLQAVVTVTTRNEAELS